MIVVFWRDSVDFKGKRILVTGASSGIGKAVALRMDKLGASVVLVARREAELSALKQRMENPCRYISYNLADVEHIEEIFAKIVTDGKLDGFVYCAGICNINPIKQVEPHELQELLNINALSFFELSRQFYKAKYSNKGSSIIGISSIAAVTAEPGMCAYAVSKAAMNTQIKIMAKEFVKRRIRVNTIMPAQVESKMGEQDNHWSYEELEEVKTYQPFGAIPIKHVVNCIEFLLSNEKAGYITGECIAITGGYKSNY